MSACTPSPISRVAIRRWLAWCVNRGPSAWSTIRGTRTFPQTSVSVAALAQNRTGARAISSTCTTRARSAPRIRIGSMSSNCTTTWTTRDDRSRGSARSVCRMQASAKRAGPRVATRTRSAAARRTPSTLVVYRAAVVSRRVKDAVDPTSAVLGTPAPARACAPLAKAYQGSRRPKEGAVTGWTSDSTMEPASTAGGPARTPSGPSAPIRAHAPVRANRS